MKYRGIRSTLYWLLITPAVVSLAFAADAPSDAGLRHITLEDFGRVSAPSSPRISADGK